MWGVSRLEENDKITIDTVYRYLYVPRQIRQSFESTLLSTHEFTEKDRMNIRLLFM